MEDPSAIVIVDASVLINFLAVDRMDLIQRHSCRFLITDHVRHEVIEHYQEQFARLQKALEQGFIEEISVTDPEEVELFAQFAGMASFGYGECACIAVAIHRGYTLALDDKKAMKQARCACPTINILTTQDLVVSMITMGLLDIAEADALKNDWAEYHKFQIKINSFSELL